MKRRLSVLFALFIAFNASTTSFAQTLIDPGDLGGGVCLGVVVNGDGAIAGGCRTPQCR